MTKERLRKIVSRGRGAKPRRLYFSGQRAGSDTYEKQVQSQEYDDAPQSITAYPR